MCRLLVRSGAGRNWSDRQVGLNGKRAGEKALAVLRFHMLKCAELL